MATNVSHSPITEGGGIGEVAELGFFCLWGYPSITTKKKLRVQEAEETKPRISQRLGPMSFVNGKLVFGDQFSDLAGYVEEEMSGYVFPSAVAVVLSTKAIFGAHVI